MKDFADRQPTKGGRRKLIHDDGSSEFVVVEMADEPTREGTPLNRQAFLAVQGFETKTTVFNDDGSITETDNEGSAKVTTFNSDGSITETFIGVNGLTSIKNTIFNSDGSISEVIV